MIVQQNAKTFSPEYQFFEDSLFLAPPINGNVNAQTLIGAGTIVLQAAQGDAFSATGRIVIDEGNANQETLEWVSKAGDTLTLLSPTTIQHEAGETVREYNKVLLHQAATQRWGVYDNAEIQSVSDISVQTRMGLAGPSTLPTTRRYVSLRVQGTDERYEFGLGHCCQARILYFNAVGGAEQILFDLGIASTYLAVITGIALGSNLRLVIKNTALTTILDVTISNSFLALPGKCGVHTQGYDAPTIIRIDDTIVTNVGLV